MSSAASTKLKTRELLQTELFQHPKASLATPVPHEEQWALTVQRSVALAKVLVCVLLGIQFNLVAGTLGMYLRERPDLEPLVEKVLRFDVLGQFCLSEVEHGLDAMNLETTATRLQNGEFELHTPHAGASKYMAPTAPSGIPSVAIVFARLISDGEDCGIRGFIVDVSDGRLTYPGITVRLVHGRVGSKPIKHCITSFNRIRLPKTALLGQVQPSTELDTRKQFLHTIWRVAVGAVSFAGPVINSLALSSHIAAKYSQRRLVGGGTIAPDQKIPIVSFKTQYRPVLIALAQSFVLRAYYRCAARQFSDETKSFEQRHALSTIFKALVQRVAYDSMLVLSERCGAQGLFGYNQIAGFIEEMRGVCIAEGDVLVLSLRLISELLIGRYELPAAQDTNGILYKHERGLFDEAASVLSGLPHHRTDAFNRLILPRCEKLTLSMGYRMAYEAAVEARLDPRIINLFRASSVRWDEGWYTEAMGVSRETMFLDEDQALNDALPFLDKWADDLEVGDYVHAPITSGERWSEFFDNLEVCPSYVNSPSQFSTNGSKLQARL
ncbi:hypothetical protein EST38_g3244 [Candolleomyces aberdarensis]|uniref:Acyl-CoA oxidase C-alpha1 domain-containing protein n=1 Tax=Candolleomyces aberdarensis TaxID=2316362 RepID=A0A4Q2DSR2_9AGAR|nr:hypothetical protein EST38_g3244 [Candolleomyces aberdarensis]